MILNPFIFYLNDFQISGEREIYFHKQILQRINRLDVWVKLISQMVRQTHINKYRVYSIDSLSICLFIMIALYDSSVGFYPKLI